MFSVAVDLGMSRTKTFLRSPPGVFQYHLMPSATAVVTRDFYGKNGDLADDNTALVKVGDRFSIVGEQAKNWAPRVRGRTEKNRTAIARTLAAIGTLVPNEAQVEVVVLLPLDEQKHYQSVESLLTAALQSFGCNGVLREYEVKSVKVFPEGAGIARLCSSDASVLMMGHKDDTVLHVRGGSISLPLSSTWTGFGMIRVIDAIHGLAARDDVSTAQALYLESRKSGKGLSRIQAGHLEKEYKEARSLVWVQLLDQIESDRQFGLSSQVMVTGGNAPFWAKELKATFGRSLSVPKPEIDDMLRRFPELKGQSMLHCGTDCYALWRSEFGVEEVAK